MGKGLVGGDLGILDSQQCCFVVLLYEFKAVVNPNEKISDRIQIKFTTVDPLPSGIPRFA